MKFIMKAVKKSPRIRLGSTTKSNGTTLNRRYSEIRLLDMGIKMGLLVNDMPI